MLERQRNVRHWFLSLTAIVFVVLAALTRLEEAGKSTGPHTAATPLSAAVDTQ